MVKKLAVLTIMSSLCYAITAGIVCACNVPVYRYALERWPADPYNVLVFHNDQMSESEKSALTWLEENSAESVYYSNYIVRTMDVNSKIPEGLQEIRNNLDSRDLPGIVVLYPAVTRIREVVWQAKLTEENAAILVNSPLRQEAAKRILTGEAGVWILLECGDSEKDNAAADTLQNCLKLMSEELRLPDLLSPIPFGQDNEFKDPREVRISFSMIRLSAENKAESAFISMLIKSEPDLSEYNSFPMAFPLYGRGRCLYTLVGKGINERNIYQACAFLTGPCSCEFKMLNPGIDLLMPVDWDSGIMDSWVAAQELPPLIGLPGKVSNDFQSGTSENKQDTSADSSLAVKNSESVSTKQLPSNNSEIKSNQTALIKENDKPLQALIDNTESGYDGARAEENFSQSGLLKNSVVSIGIVILIVFVLSMGIVFRKAGNK